jgi:hypothetical protein
MTSTKVIFFEDKLPHKWATLRSTGVALTSEVLMLFMLVWQMVGNYEVSNVVIWVVMPCILARGYRRFGRSIASVFRVEDWNSLQEYTVSQRRTEAFSAVRTSDLRYKRLPQTACLSFMKIGRFKGFTAPRDTTVDLSTVRSRDGRKVEPSGTPCIKTLIANFGGSNQAKTALGLLPTFLRHDYVLPQLI